MRTAGDFRTSRSSLAPQIEIIPGWLTASGYLQYRMERMRGTGYDIHNSAWSGNAQLRLMHWGFVLSGQYVRSQRSLWGEKISWGEDLQHHRTGATT